MSPSPSARFPSFPAPAEPGSGGDADAPGATKVDGAVDGRAGDRGSHSGDGLRSAEGLRAADALGAATTLAPAAAVVFVSNGPGELSTWVQPLAEELHQRLPLRPRQPQADTSLRLVLVPCPNGTGREQRVASRWNLFETVLPSRIFWRLLLRPGRWGPWPRQGVVVFLGGDQFWTVLLSARLGYRHLTYAEWVARWPRWNDRLALMGPSAARQLAPRWRQRATVVGDLMADLSVSAQRQAPLPPAEWVALLPGSKAAKLQLGVPFLLAVADLLASRRPNCRFLLPLAPTTSVADLLRWGDPSRPIARFYASAPPRHQGDQLITAAGTRIQLLEEHPAHGALSQCRLALTTVGANTAELGALGLPMIVLLPTQHLELMQMWDGVLGLLARLPGLRQLLGVALTRWRLRHRGLLAWPNIAAGRAVVPERVGEITPEEIAAEAADWLDHPQRLAGMQDDLRSLRGQPGAVSRLAGLIVELLPAASLAGAAAPALEAAAARPLPPLEPQRRAAPLDREGALTPTPELAPKTKPGLPGQGPQASPGAR